VVDWALWLDPINCVGEREKDGILHCAMLKCLLTRNLKISQLVHTSHKAVHLYAESDIVPLLSSQESPQLVYLC